MEGREPLKSKIPGLYKQNRLGGGTNLKGTACATASDFMKPERKCVRGARVKRGIRTGMGDRSSYAATERYQNRGEGDVRE